VAAKQDAISRKHQQHDRHENLVGNWIQHHTERGLLLPFPRQIAVEEIGDRGHHINRQRKPAGRISAIHEKACNQRHSHDAPIGENVWKVPNLGEFCLA
jgi:hypothetical protein